MVSLFPTNILDSNKRFYDELLIDHAGNSAAKIKPSPIEEAEGLDRLSAV